MAARQDQSQTIVIIICSILIVVLGFTTYWNGRQWSNEYARAEEEKTQRTQASNAARQEIGKTEELLRMIGFDAATPFEDVQAQYESDKNEYMATFPEEARLYREVLQYIFTENVQEAKRANEALAQLQALQTEIAGLRDEYKTQIEAAEEQALAAQRDLAEQQAEFGRFRENIQGQLDERIQTYAAKQREFNDAVAVAEATAAEADARAAETASNNASLQEKLDAINAPTFDVADGQVTYVNQSTGTVWINLGDADGLSRQVTFGVFEPELMGGQRLPAKASIEVTRIISEHLAEGLITSGNAAVSPVTPGDQVYNPVWERGQRRRFALTGLIDVNGDGLSDLSEVRELIAVNGALLDSYVDDQTGAVIGADGQPVEEPRDGMTIETDFLVLGEYPTEPSKVIYREGFDLMTKKADTLGVRMISLTDFLNQVGYRGDLAAPQTVTARPPAEAEGLGGQRPRNFRFRAR